MAVVLKISGSTKPTISDGVLVATENSKDMTSGETLENENDKNQDETDKKYWTARVLEIAKKTNGYDALDLCMFSRSNVQAWEHCMSDRKLHESFGTKAWEEFLEAVYFMGETNFKKLDLLQILHDAWMPVFTRTWLLGY